MSRRWFGAERGSSESRKRELDAEIEAHLAMAAADARDCGLDEDAARRQAQREFGNAALVKEVTRESWGWMWVERLWQDLQYALRLMRKSRAFSATVVGTLALGMAAATAMFTVVDRVMLRPLPYSQADRLVEIQEKGNHEPDSDPTYPDIAEWRKWSRAFGGIAFYHWARGRNFLEVNLSAQQVGSYNVSANLFAVLGVLPQIGRDFRDGLDGFAKSADASSVILSDRAWREAFGADPSAWAGR